MIKLGTKVKFRYDDNEYIGTVILSRLEFGEEYAVSCNDNKLPDRSHLAEHVTKKGWGSMPGREVIDNIEDYHRIFHVWRYPNDLEIINSPGPNTRRHDLTDGVICKTCGQFSCMAAANQPDGTFKCYSCRNNPIRGYY